MSAEFELKRQQDKQKELEKERDEIEAKLPVIRRNREAELDRIHREFRQKITEKEARLRGVTKELEIVNRHVKRLEVKAKEEAAEAELAKREKREAEKRRRYGGA
jgi:chromosome segregation ATPase